MTNTAIMHIKPRKMKRSSDPSFLIMRARTQSLIETRTSPRLPKMVPTIMVAAPLLRSPSGGSGSEEMPGVAMADYWSLFYSGRVFLAISQLCLILEIS